MGIVSDQGVAVAHAAGSGLHPLDGSSRQPARGRATHCLVVVDVIFAKEYLQIKANLWPRGQARPTSLRWATGQSCSRQQEHLLCRSGLCSRADQDASVMITGAAGPGFHPLDEPFGQVTQDSRGIHFVVVVFCIAVDLGGPGM